MHLFFDLDGTLTDSREGVIRCFQHALTKLGYEAPADDALRPYLGPALAVSFAELMGTSDPELIDRAVLAFRDRFEPVGMFENTVYPGIRSALATLGTDGFDLHVVTVKPRIYANRILEHFELAPHFSTVTGADLGDRQYTKSSLIRAACANTGVNVGTTAMIGDRAEDVQGARDNGLRAIAVTWGYGTWLELESAAPDRFVASPEDLVACVRSAR